MKKFERLKFMGMAVLACGSLGVQDAAYAGNFFAAYSNGTQQGVTVRTAKLQQVSSFSTAFPVKGIAAGPNNDVFMVSGNRIYNYTVNGVSIKDIQLSDAGIVLTDISVRGDRVYVAYKGTQRGVSVFDLGLQLLSSFGTEFDINSIAAGNNNDIYLTSANKVYRYLFKDKSLTGISFSDKGLVYTDIAVLCGKIAVAYSGSQRGVSFRDQTTLAQSSNFTTGFEIAGIVVGTDNDVYLGSGYRLYNYTLDGVQKQSFSLPQRSVMLGDMGN